MAYARSKMVDVKGYRVNRVTHIEKELFGGLAKYWARESSVGLGYELSVASLEKITKVVINGVEWKPLTPTPKGLDKRV